MQKNVKRLSKVSVILVFLMMFSCVRDDFYEKDSPNLNETTVKHYQGSQARALISRFKQGVLNSTRFSLQSNNGITYRTVNEVSISEEEVMEVKDSLGNVNYTFRVEGLSQRGSGEFYNIVINNRDGKERAFLLKYVMDPKFQTEYESGNSSIEMFRGILFIASLAGGGNPCDENIVVPVVPGNGGAGGGAGHGNGGVGVETGNGSYNNGGGLAYIQEVVYQLAMGCQPPPGGCEEDDVWEDCECWRYVSVNPRYYRVGIFPVLSDTPDPCGDTIGTIGVLPNKNHEKNCEKLKEMSDDPALKIALEDLQTKTNELVESGYSVTKSNGSSNYGQPTNIPSAPNTPWKIDMTVGGDHVGAFHTHWHPMAGMFPMFSGEDVEFLYMVAAKHASNGIPKNYSEYFLTLTTVNGTHAIKIDNFQQFRNKIGILGVDVIIRTINDGYDKVNPYSEQDTTIAFLNALKELDLGISLYKANNNLTNWKKLSLGSPLSIIIETPCN